MKISLFHSKKYSGVTEEGRFLFLPRLAKHRSTLCFSYETMKMTAIEADISVLKITITSNHF